MKRALICVIAVALLAAGAATAATPTQYRSHLNGICRFYTPKFKRLEAVMAAAEKANEPKTYGVALGELLVYGLTQDRRLEAIPVPASMKAQMAPILTEFKASDVHIVAALIAARAGDSKRILTELKAMGATGAKLNPRLDAAGLRDCGSNQT